MSDDTVPDQTLQPIQSKDVVPPHPMDHVSESMPSSQNGDPSWPNDAISINPVPPQKNGSKKTIALLTLLFLTVGIIGGVIGIRYSQEIRKNAEGCTDINAHNVSATGGKAQAVNITGTAINNCHTAATVYALKFWCTGIQTVNGHIGYCNDNFTINQYTIPAATTDGPGTVNISETQLVGNTGTCGSAQIDLSYHSTFTPSSVIIGNAAYQDNPCTQNTPTPTLTTTPAGTPTSTGTPTATPTPPSSTPTPTPTLTPTPTPSRLGCNQSCTNDSGCLSGLSCSSGFCRNPSCTQQSNCNCELPTPTPMIPVSGSGPGVLGITAISGGMLLLLLGLAL